MIIIVVIAARKTKPPKTPRAIIPPIFNLAEAVVFTFDRETIKLSGIVLSSSSSEL